MTANTITWDSIRAEVLADPVVKAEYEALEAEFSIASQLISLRAATGLTQGEFAELVGMKQSQLARIESGKQIPKLDTLAKLAAGAGYNIEVHFIPLKSRQTQKIKPLQIALSGPAGATPPPPVLETPLPLVLGREPLTEFLGGDDSVAVMVRERLEGRSLQEIAAEVEECLSVLKEKDRIKAVKKVLAGSGTDTSGRNTRASNGNNDEIELLNLAEKLLEKLATILE